MRNGAVFAEVHDDVGRVLDPTDFEKVTAFAMFCEKGLLTRLRCLVNPVLCDLAQLTKFRARCSGPNATCSGQSLYP